MEPPKAECPTCGGSKVKVTPRCTVPNCTPARQAVCGDPMCQMNDTRERCGCAGGYDPKARAAEKARSRVVDEGKSPERLWRENAALGRLRFEVDLESAKAGQSGPLEEARMKAGEGEERKVWRKPALRTFEAFAGTLEELVTKASEAGPEGYRFHLTRPDGTRATYRVVAE